MIACVAADGTLVPESYILKAAREIGTKVESMSAATGLPASNFYSTNNGWTCTEIFTDWCQSFVDFVAERNRVAERPPRTAILIVDGHSSYTDHPKALDVLATNGVIAVSLPSHCSHFLQPLDVSVFASVKRKFDSLVSDHFLCPDNALTRWDVPALANKALHSALQGTEAVANGFRRTGMWPVPQNPALWVTENKQKLKLKDPSLQQTLATSLEIEVTKNRAADAVVDKVGNVTLKAVSVRALFGRGPDGYMDDSIIRYYLLGVQAEARHDYPETSTAILESVAFANFDANTLRSDWQTDLEADTVILPVHEASGNHWWLAARTRDKDGPNMVRIYDSLGNSSARPNAGKVAELFQVAPEELQVLADDQVATQTNSYDCGVFVMLYARAVLTRGEVTGRTVNQAAATQLRSTLACSIGVRYYQGWHLHTAQQGSSQAEVERTVIDNSVNDNSDNSVTNNNNTVNINFGGNTVASARGAEAEELADWLHLFSERSKRRRITALGEPCGESSILTNPARRAAAKRVAEDKVLNEERDRLKRQGKNAADAKARCVLSEFGVDPKTKITAKVLSEFLSSRKVQFKKNLNRAALIKLVEERSWEAQDDDDSTKESLDSVASERSSTSPMSSTSPSDMDSCALALEQSQAMRPQYS